MKKLFLCITLIFCVNSIFAQFTFKTDNQKIIEKVLCNGVFISKQRFQIRDTKSGELFGLNGKKEFGAVYSLGVKIVGGILLTDKAVNPWNYDNKFDRYKDQYSPVLLDAYYSAPKETAEYEKLLYSDDSKDELVTGSIYKFSSETFSGKGFDIDTSEGDKEGWLVWITADKEMNKEKSSQISCTVYSKSINVTSDNKSFSIDSFNTFNEVLGGIYLVASYKNIGSVEFNICGVLIKVDGKWKLVCPFVGMERNESSEEIVGKPKDPITEEPSELTPVEDTPSKRKSKNR